jgi:hypothetical protein
VATIFSVVSAVFSTVLYSILVGVLNNYLKPYDIKFELGHRMIALEFIAAAFSVAASLFWTISICCCSGKSNRREKKSNQQPVAQGFTGYAPFGNKGYEPLGEGNRGSYPPPQQNVEMQEYGYTGYKGGNGPYEPYRQV